MLTDVN